MIDDDERVTAALAAAFKQLETAVQEQETAVNRILGIAERLMDAPDRVVQIQAEAIFEACSFQDLTGQRIRKVSRFLKALASQGGIMAAPPVMAAQGGPSAKSEGGLSQEEVDRLLSGRAPKR